MYEMLEGDFTRARSVFESAARMDFKQYPLPQNDKEQPAIVVPFQRREEPEFGTAAYGFSLDL